MEHSDNVRRQRLAHNMTSKLDETWQRIRAANEAVGWAGWPLAQRDQIEALADDLNRDLRYPVIHCWATNNGSQLTFWCRYCKDYHTHGRHHGPETMSYYLDDERAATEHPDSPLPQHMWHEYLSRFGDCTYNSRYPGGKGFCTCPMGSADGHRVEHCWKEDSAYRGRGYLLHEVPANDKRACAKPKRRTRKH